MGLQKQCGNPAHVGGGLTCAGHLRIVVIERITNGYAGAGARTGGDDVYSGS
jgi:hypothetical protein